MALLAFPGEWPDVNRSMREPSLLSSGRVVLKVELDQEWRITGRIWVYEAKILTPEGDVLKVEYDARSLELIEVERPKPKRRHDRS